MATVGSIVVDLLARTGSFNTDIDRSTRQAERRMREFEKQVKQAAAAVGTAVAGLGVAFGAAMQNVINKADETEKAAQKLGMTGEALTTLRHAADLSGVSADQLSAGLNRLNKSAAEGNKAFEAIGVSVRDANGNLKSSDQLLKDVAGKFAGYRDGAAKAALAQELFGKSGAELIPLLNAGSDGISEMQAEAEALGLVLDQNTRKAAEAFNDNLTRLKRAQEGITTQIAAQMLPTFLNLSDRMVAVSKNSDAMAYAARTAATALKLLLSSGVIVGAVFKTVGEAVGATAAAVVQAARGEFGAAWDILQMGVSDVAANVRGAMGAIDAVWDESAAKARAIASDPDSRPDAPLLAAAKGAVASSRTIKRAAADALRAQQQLMSEGARVFESTRTPAEAYAAQIERLNLLLGAGAISHDTYSRAVLRAQEAFNGTQESIKALIAEQERLNSLLAATPTGQLDAQRDTMQFLARAFQDGKISAEQFSEAAMTALGNLPDAAAAAGDSMSAFADQAARNMQTAFADFLFNPFEGGLKGMAHGFAQTLHRMASEMLASQVFKMLGGALGGAGGFAGFIGGMFGGARASGGPVSSGRTYLVGERGPELFTPNTAGAIVPNHALGQQAPPQVNVRNINVLDPGVVGDYLGTDAGEQLIMNVVQRNRRSLAF